MGKGLHAGVFNQAAPQPTEEFDEHRGSHDQYCREAQADDGTVGGVKPVEALERDLKEGGYHYDREDKNAERFETSSAHRVRVLVIARYERRGGPNDGST